MAVFTCAYACACAYALVKPSLFIQMGLKVGRGGPFDTGEGGKVEKEGNCNQNCFLQQSIEFNSSPGMVISIDTVKSITKTYCHFIPQSSL